MKPGEFATKKYSLIEKAASGLLDDIPAVQKSIYEEINKLIKRIPTKDGKFVLNAENYAAINDLAKQVTQIIQNSRYPTRVREYLRNFDEIDEITSSLHFTLNGIDKGQMINFIVNNPAKAIMARKAAVNLASSGVNSAFIQPVKDLIIESAMAGTSLTDFENTLRNFVLGNDEKLGHLERYVGQVARDGLYQYNGAIQNEIAKEFDLTEWGYAPGEVEDTRPFCLHLIGKETFDTEWLQGALNEFCPGGTPSDADTYDTANGKKQKKGAGMIPGTTIDNVAINRGGYNCRHELIPQ